RGGLVLSEGQVELVGSEPRRRDPSRDDRLDPLVVDDAAAELGVVDEITERVLHHLDLEDAGIVDAPGQGEEPRAHRATAAECRERRTAVIDDPRQIRHRLDVVDHSRFTVETGDGGEERRLDAGEAALALQRLDQRSLFAADVRPRARVHYDVDGEVRTEDLVAERAELVGVVDGLLNALETEGELAAHENENRRDLERVGRDDDALHQLVRIAFEEQMVLEGGGLGLVTVHHEIRHGRLAQHRPFATGRKTGAPATEQRRLVNLAGHRFGEHRERLAQALVTAGREVARQGVGVGELQARQNNWWRGHRRHYFVSLGVRASRAATAALRSAATSARDARSPPARRPRMSVPCGGTSWSNVPARSPA